MASTLIPSFQLKYLNNISYYITSVQFSIRLAFVPITVCCCNWGPIGKQCWSGSLTQINLTVVTVDNPNRLIWPACMHLWHSVRLTSMANISHHFSVYAFVTVTPIRLTMNCFSFRLFCCKREAQTRDDVLAFWHISARWKHTWRRHL